MVSQSRLIPGYPGNVRYSYITINFHVTKLICKILLDQTLQNEYGF